MSKRTNRINSQAQVNQEMTAEEKDLQKKIERKEKNARTFSWLYFVSAAVVLVLVILFLGRGYGLQKNSAAEITTQSQQEIVEPEVLGDVEVRTDRGIDYIVMQAEMLYDDLTTENAADTNAKFIELMAELEKLEESDIQRSAYAYISMMHAVAQNVVNQQYDVKYAADEADCRQLVESNREIYMQYNGF